MTSITRRTMLGGIAATAVPTVAIAAPPAAIPMTIDEFLARATAAERVRYHSNAAAEAMAEIRPDARGWRVETSFDEKAAFVFIVPRLGGQMS